MAVELLERDPLFLTLNDLLRQAGEGHGRIALISGEAGIGKTALVERFLAQCSATDAACASVGGVRGALHAAPARPPL